ncbi:hypothetical protein GCM10010343_38370 [Streptomyces avidinii]|uniref:Integrase-like protein n=1 Tax=Streptomyces avidinii TaxID=1895 RepID=A0ABS4L6S0_STRAV|nr:hypothetical protein [Streptomyces avidinii]GGZ08441.1 hypothetical protein GCM10010343_38370 [Streptomyces avidinii]
MHGCVSSTLRNYQGSVWQFCDFLTDPAYGWSDETDGGPPAPGRQRQGLGQGQRDAQHARRPLGQIADLRADVRQGRREGEQREHQGPRTPSSKEAPSSLHQLSGARSCEGPQDA